MHRRDLLKLGMNLGAFSLASTFLPQRVFAQSQSLQQTPQFFVLFQAEGGWDTTLSLDPWTSPVRPQESDYFMEYRHEELIPFAGSFVGPTMSSLTAYFDRMTVLNGLFITATDGGHESAAIYAASGDGQGHLGLFPLELEGKILKSQFGTLSNSAVFTGNKNKVIWDTNTAINSSRSANNLLLDLDDRVHTDLTQARQALLRNSSRMSEFQRVLAATPEGDGNHRAIAAAFASGLSNSAVISARQDLDSHSNHPGRHATELTQFFEGVAAFLKTLESLPGLDSQLNRDESRSLLDQTTVLVTSEFTRTPALNTSKGKDHNPQCNSALVFSSKLKPRKLGASSLITRSQSRSGVPYLAASPLDNQTLQPVYQRSDSFIMRPENVMATLSTALSLAPSKISSALGQARILSSIIK